MTNRRIALILTACYWASAALVATLTPRGDWIDLRWPMAILFFAIPATILLWMAVIGVHYFKPTMPRSRFTLIGVALPIVYLAVVAGAGRWLSERSEKRLESQLRVSELASFDDEPLIGARGPIGVRLHYDVIYPRGLDLDEAHGAFAQVGTDSSRLAFVMIQRTVSPHISERFRPGRYAITEDFLPGFLPPSLVYPTLAPAAPDNCFNWSSATSRQQILMQSAEPLTVVLYLTHSPIQRSTQHRYRIADFYATAAQEGALDCAK